MNMLKRLLPAVLAPFLVFMSIITPLTSLPAQAASDDGSKYFSDCKKTGDKWTVNGATYDNQILCVAVLIFNWMTYGVTTIVVIMVVIGAIQYMLAGDSQEKAKNAIRTIRNALIAVLLFLLMYAIINYVVPGGV